MDIPTGQLTLDQCVDLVLKRLEDDRILQNNEKNPIAQSLVKAASAEEQAALKELPSIDLDEEQVQYLQTIGQGWAYPLTKFMDEMQLLEVLQMNTLTDRTTSKKHLFSVPITQHVTAEQAEKFKSEKRLALKCSKVSEDVLAVIEEPVFFANRKEEISTRTFGTFSQKHDKIENIMKQGDFLVSGKSMTFTAEVKFNDGYDQYRMTPAQINDIAQKRGCDALYAFQVRNPLHNGHVLLLKDTREQLLKLGYKNPILLLHPLGGWQKEDDVPLPSRIKQHQALLDDGTLNPEHTILGIWPSPMYYGGPTEVLWHASSRAYCGITHFITGRDPAGLKHPENTGQDLYDVWHGQKLLVHVKSMINVQICPFKVAAYNKKSS